MTKAEIKKAADNEIIYRYIKVYSLFLAHLNANVKTKGLEKELVDLDAEMLKRGLLTEDQIKELNSWKKWK